MADDQEKTEVLHCFKRYPNKTRESFASRCFFSKVMTSTLTLGFTQRNAHGINTFMGSSYLEFTFHDLRILG